MLLAGSTLAERMLDGKLGGDPEFRRAYERWNPKNAESAHRLVRDYASENPVPFVRGVITLRTAFLDYGRELEPVTEAGAEGGTAKQALKDWLRNPLPGTRATGQTLVDKLCADVLGEWCQQDSAVVSWQENSPRPYVLLPEDCRYTSRGGRERLEWRHGLHGNELDEFVKAHPAAMQADVRKRYEKDFIPIEDPVWNAQYPAFGSYRTVATRDRWGGGLGLPRLRGLIHALDQYRNMELGEAAYSFAGRKVNRQYKAGYAIKSGDQAGTVTTHAPREWSAKAKAMHFGRQGYYETPTNWDQEQVLHWLDVKSFDPEKWKSVLTRAVDWAGPVGRLLLGDGQQLENLWRLFRAEVDFERRQLRGLLAEVIGEFAPGPVELCWSNDCFLDPRVWSELFRQGFSAGTFSNHTLAETLGSDLAEEMEHKLEELAAEKQDPGVLKPIYDAAHGNGAGDAALAAGDAGGRPTGT